MPNAIRSHTIINSSNYKCGGSTIITANFIMKSKILFTIWWGRKSYFLVVMISLKTVMLFGQCTNQVLHTTGTSIVNGVNVTVTSSGNVDTISSYCNSTFPYFVGYNYSTGSGNGTYTFNFSPAINSLSLNFGGISNIYTGLGQEVIVLYINGIHYSIPAVGTANGCGPMAVLTSSGDITGCTECGVSGWNGTNISGTISSLTVLDSAIWGTGNGAVFSLFICKDIFTNVDPEEIKTNYKLFPNPFSNQTTLTSATLLHNGTLTVANSFGQIVKEIKNISGQTLTLSSDNLSRGMYFIRLTEGNTILFSDKLVFTD